MWTPSTLIERDAAIHTGSTTNASHNGSRCCVAVSAGVGVAAFVVVVVVQHVVFDNVVEVALLLLHVGAGIVLLLVSVVAKEFDLS